MNRTRIALNHWLVCGLFMGMLALLLSPSGGAGAVALAPSCGQWSIVNSPSRDTMDDLYGIAALSPQDVWAVGRYVDTQNEALIEHWNGKRWSIVTGANLGSASSFLGDVAAVSSSDVWAVGGSSSGTLIEHWDGASWSLIKSPGAGILVGVSTLSSTDIWAVGASAGQTLIEQWNGTQWSIIKSPNPGKFGNGLASVAAISPMDVWAVGESFTTQFGYQTLAEHWNGTNWRVVKTPPLGSSSNELRGVSALAANDIWAVGSLAMGNISLTVTEHWNGTQWSAVPSPSPTGDDYLLGVAAVSSKDVWAVGDYSPAGQNLVVQWTGTSWNVVPSPYRHGAISGLSAISADSAADVWAAGLDINTHNFAYHTLIEHYC